MSISSIPGFDFQAARARQQELVGMYRNQKRFNTMTPELEIEYMAMIEEIDMEIADAHKSVNAKMTTVSSSGHSVMHIGNVISPIVTQWQGNVKEAVKIDATN